MTFIKISFIFFREIRATMMSLQVPDDIPNPIYVYKDI